MLILNICLVKLNRIYLRIKYSDMLRELPFNWTCPHCEHSCVVTSDNFSFKVEGFDENVKIHTHSALISTWILCPNPECKRLTLTAHLVATPISENPVVLREWQLIPESKAKVFPKYIPQAIRNDYTEACVILNGSPKASATLARRCLQGMIRDFWGVNGKSNLYEEINAIEDKVDRDMWEAIDSVRKIGNIGAHMEKEIDKIIEVEPDEAQTLIELIEMLMEEWYVHRHQKAEKIKKVKEIGIKKTLEKK